MSRDLDRGTRRCILPGFLGGDDFYSQRDDRSYRRRLRAGRAFFFFAAARRGLGGALASGVTVVLAG